MPKIKVPDEVYDFLNELTPSDVGCEPVGSFIVCFEGFTGECWADAKAKGKSVADLTHDILDEWDYKGRGKNLIQSGWTAGDEPGSDTVFYGIYRRNSPGGA
jgi:hypothetical protein